MKRWLAILVLLAAALAGEAADRWQFEAPVAVTGPPRSGIFHHLDGAGRKHIAQARDRVVAAWEDNRRGVPQVFVSTRNGSGPFAAAVQVSTGREAYEPSIAGLSDGRFLIAWEQDGGVFLSLLNGSSLSAPLRIGNDAASHAAVATHGQTGFAAWRERTARGWRLRVARLDFDEQAGIGIETVTSVEGQPLQTEMQFPVLAANAEGVWIAWEDRRAGHTRLMFSYSPRQFNGFNPPLHLNEFFSNRNQYDKGSGVTRVSLAAFGTDEVLAAWMDKRRGGVGYGIFAALGADASFGPNERVHGARGDLQPHYNPAVSGNPTGDFVVAWDDFRNGDADVWLSAYGDADSWSEDHAPEVASGPGEQSHPAIALDRSGNLHLLWIARADPNAPSQLFYSYGKAR